MIIGTMNMENSIQKNQEVWDSWTDGHVASALYNVPAFKAGRCTLPPCEIEEIGDVSGKRLLHLQCHFGLDTMSWARRGAKVVGMDFSETAIRQARSLAEELDIAAEFVCCSVYDLPVFLENLQGEFDIVYTSAGVLCWLPDLTRWAQVIAHFLAPDGFFYIREFHPFSNIFDNGKDIPTVHYPYFHSDEPMVFSGGGDSYAGGKTPPGGESHEWAHSMSDSINSLLEAGLRIEFLHEFPYTVYQATPFLTRGEDGLWRYAPGPDLPLMFSLKATKNIDGRAKK
jgi:SAM-dependent methyltransferase